MSIQRWDINPAFMFEPEADGRYVLYADHVTAMLNAELTHQREWMEARDAGLSAARDAVDAACGWRPAGRCSECTHALAAIDALKGEA